MPVFSSFSSFTIWNVKQVNDDVYMVGFSHLNYLSQDNTPQVYTLIHLIVVSIFQYSLAGDSKVWNFLFFSSVLCDLAFCMQRFSLSAAAPKYQFRHLLLIISAQPIDQVGY